MKSNHVVCAFALLSAVAWSPHVQAGGDVTPPSLVGAWTLNGDLSDRPGPPDAGQRGPRGGPGGRGGGMGRGGLGRGGGGFGGGRQNGAGEREAMERTREAMRDIMTAAEHLTIVQTETTIIVTAQDGRTTRLAPGGKKIKDASTGISRETKWDGDNLVCEVTGLARGKITETYTVDREQHQLTLTLTMEGMQGREQTVRRVYDDDATSR